MAREKEYTNGEVTIVWRPNLCFHAKNCINGLPSVFDYQSRPWIKPEGANSQEIIDQVKACPSGALTYYMNAEGKPEVADTVEGVQLTVIPNGPVLFEGPLKITMADGSEEITKKGALCRCGASRRKPFCDGSHKKIGFEG